MTQDLGPLFSGLDTADPAEPGAAGPEPEPEPEAVAPGLGQQVLREVFGHPGYRHGQREAVEALIGGRDVQVLLPTGGGKSLCYQVPAVVAMARGRGPTLVVSPLVSLMQDQVAALKRVGVDAACLYRGQPSSERTAIRRGMSELTLLYASPERVALSGFRRQLQRAGIAQVAIDEAHCISEWGHDFRTDYKTLGVLRAELRVPTIALTATATSQVMDEVRTSLGLVDPVVVRGRFERPNLALSVEHHTGDNNRTERLIGLLRERGLGRDASAGRAIVYGATRKRVQAVAKALRGAGFAAGFYHAGRTDSARANAQQSFEQGKTAVLVATTAFGMGIDHPDVRLVVHVQAPGSLEAYYQQAGRAGRDGAPAACVLLYAPGDAVTQARLRGPAPLPGAESGWKALQDYVFSERCRQGSIVAWFSGEVGVRCGCCDACTDPDDLAESVAAARARGRERADAKASKRSREAGMSLTGAQYDQVVDYVANLKRPVGRSLVALGLRGSTSKRLNRLGLKKHSHHGVMRGVPEAVILAAIDDLLDAGRLAPRGRKYPTLWLPDKRVRSASSTPRRSSTKATGLTRALKNWRQREARKRRIKPYQVMQDAVIDRIVASRPDNVRDLMELKGIGPTRVARYSQAILEMVRTHPDG